MDLTVGREILAEVKIQRGIFQRDAFSPLLFVIAMIPFIHILRKSAEGYKFINSQEKFNYLMYMDDIKLFAKYEKELENIQLTRIYNQDIGMEFSIEKCAILIMGNGKRQITEGIELN